MIGSHDIYNFAFLMNSKTSKPVTSPHVLQQIERYTFEYFLIILRSFKNKLG